MTWHLSKVIRNSHQNYPQLMMSVTMEFQNLDDNGIVIDKRTYIEPNVSLVTDEGIARLAKNQLDQLQLIASTPIGEVTDLTSIKSIINPPPPPAITPDEQLAQKKRDNVIALLKKRSALAQAVEAGAIAADDNSIVDVQTALDAAYKDDPDLMLSLLGA